VWDVTGQWNGKWPAPKLDDNELAKLWSDLASDQATRAFKAVWALALSPAQSVPYLANQFFPKQLAHLVADLEDDVAAVRDKAFAELKELGPMATNTLRRAKPLLPEAIARVRHLLDPKSASPMSAVRRLQMTRAMEALELADSPVARALLADLALEDWIGAEAGAALKRLSDPHHGVRR
jgi:hypothetical protein